MLARARALAERAQARDPQLQASEGAAKAVTVWSASYRARLNRRSTIRCTRRRSGLNSAAATRVEPATATGVDSETGSAWVASSTSPAYTPTSSPVTIAYASVREMIRSMSYSRYLKMATPMLSGSARSPAVTITLTMCRKPDGLPDCVKLIARQTPLIADPASSHFNCSRRSPDERR
jgi:hypothetical protein